MARWDRSTLSAALTAGAVILILGALWWGADFPGRRLPPPRAGKDAADRPPPELPEPEPRDPVLVQVERLKSASLEEHQQAVAALARMGPEASSAIPALTVELRQCALDDPWPRQRRDSHFLPVQQQEVPSATLSQRQQHAREIGKALAAIDPKDPASPFLSIVLFKTVDRPMRFIDAPNEKQKYRMCRVYFAALEEMGPAAIPAMIAEFRENRWYQPFAERPRPTELVSVPDWETVAGFGPLFAHMGPACVPALRAALKDKDAQVRRYAALGLGNAGQAAAAAADLRERLGDDNDDVRLAAACSLLGRTADETGRVLPVLIEMMERLAAVPDDQNLTYADLDRQRAPRRELTDEEAHTRIHKTSERERRWRFLAALLGEIGPQAEPAADALAALLRKRRQLPHLVLVLRRLGAAGKMAAPALLELVREAKPEGFTPALEALAVIGPAARETVGPQLRRLLEDQDLVLRWRAFQALGAIDPEAAVKACPSLQGVVAALDLDEERARQQRRVRRESITAAAPEPLNLHKLRTALDALTARDVSTIPLLLGAWQSRQDWASEPAMHALVRMGPAAEPAIPVLVAVTEREPEPWQALGILEAVGKPAVPALRLQVMRNKTPAVRKAVLVSLEKIGPEAALASATSALRDRDEEVRKTAAEMLGRFGPDAKDAVPALRAALKDVSEAVRRQAAETLGRVGPEGRDALPDLIRAFTDDAQLVTDPETRKARSVAVRAASRIGKDAVDPLIAALRDENPRIRAGAAEALGRIGPDSRKALPRLLQLSSSERETPEVRAAAEEARKKLEGE